MIGYLRGSVQDNSDGRMLVTIGDDRGAVGYSVAVPGSPDYALIAQGQALTLFIYTHVREDQLDLYGFASKTEKDLFLALLSVTGIGPKGALGILSGGRPTEIFEAILSKDKDFLTRIPGIGKKTAERVVLELADSLRKKVDTGALVLPPSKQPGGASARAARGDGPMSGESAAVREALRDAKEALLGLGYREQEIVALLARLMAPAQSASQGAGANSGEVGAALALPPRRAEDIVKAALRHLS